MSLDIPMIKAILFDVDGTISDTDDKWVENLVNILRPVRWLFPAECARSFARWLIMTLETPGNLVYTSLDWTHVDDDLGKLFGFFARRNIGRKPKEFWLIDGVEQALQKLQRKYILAIVSARDRPSTDDLLNQYGLVPLFQVVTTSQTCQHTKPFPDPIIWTAQQLGFTPQECLMVGDTTVDIRAGKAAGCQTVGVLCGFGRERELRRAGADLILKSTAELADLLL